MNVGYALLSAEHLGASQQVFKIKDRQFPHKKGNCCLRKGDLFTRMYGSFGVFFYYPEALLRRSIAPCP